MSRRGLSLWLVWAVGCAEGSAPIDGGFIEDGASDLGVADARDTGLSGDATPGDVEGGELDASVVDAGLFDASLLDASAPDAGPIGTSSLAAARDRLLESEASLRGQSHCERWQTMSPTERGVFLTITDLLGKRTRLEDGSFALDHVVALWAIRDARTSGCVRCCGGGEYNRLYLSADDALIAAFRTLGSSLSPWKTSTDAAGPHAPFDQSAMTEGGLPEGQAHYFTTDAASVVLDREGVQGVEDPHVVEIDIDYNLIHDSNPVCTYGNESGLELYERSFMSVGQGGSAELDYVPGGC